MIYVKVSGFDKKIYDVAKEIFSGEDCQKARREIFKTYQSFNARYLKTTRYEKAIERQLGIDIERI